MPKSWVVLHTQWNLEKVQAGLNVVLTALGILSVWTFGRFCRQHATAKIIHRHQSVPLPTLLTISGPGAVWEVLLLLRHKIFTRRNVWLLAQCVFVSVFTALTFFSGILANISLNRGSQLRDTTVPGLMPNAHGTGYTTNAITSNVVWNLTHQALDNANFPPDQLLDFIPDFSVPWVYHADQWNSTWSLACNKSTNVPIDIGEPTQAFLPFSNLYGAFPGAQKYFPSQYQNNSAYRLTMSSCGIFDARDSVLRKLIYYILYSSNPVIEDNMYLNERPLHFTLGALGIQHVPFENLSSTTKSARMVGSPEASFLSRIECTLERSRPVADVKFTAWPWTNDTQSLVTAYADYNRWNSISSFLAGDENYLTTADELVRFFQVYTIMKDTWEFSTPVRRTIRVVFSTVELSTVCLALTVFAWLIVLLVNLRYLKFWVPRRHELDRIPDSALDWMIHASDIEKKDCQVYLDSVKARKLSDAWYEPLPVPGARSRVNICEGICMHDQQITEDLFHTKDSREESISLEISPAEEFTETLDKGSSRLEASTPERDCESQTDGTLTRVSESIRSIPQPQT